MIALAKKHWPQPPKRPHRKVDGLVNTVYVGMPPTPDGSTTLPPQNGHSPQLDVASESGMDGLVHSWIVGIPPLHGASAAASSTPARTQVGQSRREGTGRSGFGWGWIAIVVIGGLIRAAANSNRNPPRPDLSGTDRVLRQMAAMDRNLTEPQRAVQKLAEWEFFIKCDPKNAVAYNARAWIFATFPDARVRDGRKAVEEATLACKLTNEKSAYCLGTLAAAYAETGNFKKAVEWQAKAQKGYTKEERAKWSFLLDLYKSGKPYREPLQIENSTAPLRQLSPLARPPRGMPERSRTTPLA